MAILGVYASIALVAVAVARARQAALGSVSGPPAWALIGALWPFLLPGATAAPTRAGRYATRLIALHRAMREALDDPTSARLLARPRTELEAALARLDEASARLADLDVAIAHALPVARPRLETLRDRADAALAERAALLEEVIAQLTVLRFADLSAELTANDALSRERERVEALLAQLDCLALG